MEDKLNLEFYQNLARRPAIDVVQDIKEQEHWNESFKNSNGITLYSWRTPWLENTKKNLEHFKYFNRDHSIKVFANELINRPVILVGAGPSLKNNIEYLRMAKEAGVAIIASHHALMYLSQEHIRIKPDYALVLDAGKTWTEYYGDLDFYNDVPLLADQVCDHEQLKLWKGPIFFYRSAQPTEGEVANFLKMEMERIISPNMNGSIIEVGGHVMGAMVSVSRGVMRANTIIFVGADYSFAPEGNFYPFDFTIDKEVPAEHFGGKEGEKLPAPPGVHGMIYDIFGNQVGTSSSYLQFKNVMDIGIKVNMQSTIGTAEDLDFINASEGGALGALVGGNSKWMKYMRLEDAILYAKNKLAIQKVI
jgi:hypothetical protein